MNSKEYAGRQFEPERAAEEIGISPEAYKRLCRLFVDSTRKDLEALRSAVAAGDCATAATTAHHIKGSARNMDFEDLAAIAEEVTRRARSCDLAGMPKQAQQLEEEFASVAAAVEEHL
jgi:HPt (histidine-containing phosphotransfer) domain-containing protein